MKSWISALTIIIITIVSCHSPEVSNSYKYTSKDPVIDSPQLASKNVVPEESDSEAIKTAKSFLQRYFKDDIEKGILDSAGKKFMVAECDLNNDGKNEFIIGFTQQTRVCSR